MAGEIEETFSINLQANSIHSGSISFGRFETEPLSWERRSSFSHNRYLEEVEKCSKPGSVIEKKAYFEAHFKKKGLFGIMPSAGHDRSDRENSENDGSEEIGNQDDFESNDGHYVEFEGRPREDFEPNEDEQYVKIEKFQDELNESDYYIQFDQRSQEDFELDEANHYVKMEQISQMVFEPNDDGSDYHGECGVIRYEREDAIRECPIVSFSSLQTESDMKKSNDLEDSINKSNTLDEAHQSENEASNMLSDIHEAITEVKKEDDDTVSTEESSRNIRMTVNEPVQGIEKTILHDPANHSLKPEPGLNSEFNNIQVQKSTFSRSSKDHAKNQCRESPRRAHTEKNLSKLAAPTTRSMNKSSREVSVSVKTLFHPNKSEKLSRVKNDAESQPPVLKTDSKGIQEAERLNQAFYTRKYDVRPRAATFNFKSSERAERRKEFYLKLEEKMHAKEAKMNQMHAISQEKKEADLRKLRKSLNFKAKPMPSFYSSTLPSQSHGNKVVSNNNRSKKVQNQPKCQGSGAGTGSPSKSKMENDQAAGESVTSTEPRSIKIEDSPQPNETPAPSTNQSCHPNSATNNHTSGKKERAKVTLQKHKVKHKVSESCKGVKGQSNEGSKNGETTKHRSEIMRKGVSNAGLRSGSRSGNLTVRVAS